MEEEKRQWIILRYLNRAYGFNTCDYFSLYAIVGDGYVQTDDGYWHNVQGFPIFYKTKSEIEQMVKRLKDDLGYW